MINKSILLFLFSLIASITFAQIAKRNLIIEGGANLQLINTKTEGFGGDVSETEGLFFATPQVTYFISDRFAAGGGLIIASAASSSFGINGNARFYLSNQPSSAWFLKAEIGYFSNSTFNQISGNAGLGWDIFLSPNVALESTMTIGFTETNEFLGGSNTQFLIGTGLKFFFDRLPEELPEDRNVIIQKGNSFLGLTSGSIRLSRRNNVTTSFVNLMPQFGKFVSDRILFGSLFDLTNQSGSGFNFFSIDATPFIRYYLNPAGKKFVPFGELGGGISLVIINGDFIPNGNSTETNPIFFANIGFDYFIRSNVAIEIKADYRFTQQNDFFKLNTFGINVGFNFFIDRS